MFLKRPQLSALVLMLALIGLTPRLTHAHRFGGPNDPCERKVGNSLVHITLYQPQFDPDAEYCDQIPRAGNTVLVVDVLGEELRKLPLAVRVSNNSSSKLVVAQLPPTIYRRGVADAQVMLSSGETYTTEISIGEGASTTLLSFPVRVAAWYRPLIKPAIAFLVLLALITISVLRYYLSADQEEPQLQLVSNNQPKSSGGERKTERRASGSRLRISILPLLMTVGCVLAMAACHSEASRPVGSLPDAKVIDDHGNPVSLASLKGKVVLLDFIHVGCPGVCSNLVNKFGQVADSLGPKLGSQVVLLSVTNDPTHDNPAELLKLAQSSQADMKGWLFVTGTPDEIDRVIKAFGVNNERLPDGSPNHITRVFLLGTDGRQKHEYQGMVMNSAAVVAQIKDTLAHAGAS